MGCVLGLGLALVAVVALLLVGRPFNSMSARAARMESMVQRRSAEHARAQLAAIVDSLEDAIVGADLDGVIVSWNRGAEKLYGYAEDEIVGRHASLLVPADRRAETGRVLEDLLESGSAGHLETLRLRKDDSLVPVSLTFRPVHGARGDVVAVATIARDISERRRMEAELAAAHDRATELSRLKSEFLGSMSHEIRTPLNAVVGLTELLAEGTLDDDQRQLADGVLAASGALLALIDEVLDFSKIESGHLELETADLDVAELLEEVAELVAAPARSRHLELAVEWDPELVTDRRGDRSRLRQVLLHLASNAVKFTEQGGVILRARRATGGAVRFEIVDTGIGIAPADVPRLFEPFEQADASTTRRHGGTGLGLAISQRIVEAMGGCIGVESSPGTGSTFWFVLPLEATAAADLSVAARLAKPVRPV